MRFGYIVWVLATVSGYVVFSEMNQGKGISAHSVDNRKIVGVAAASVLDLLDLIPEEKLSLPHASLLTTSPLSSL
jgi:hypothetical protein